MAGTPRNQPSAAGASTAAAKARRTIEDREITPAPAEIGGDDLDTVVAPASALDVFDLNAQAGSGSATAGVEEAAQRRLDPLFESVIEDGDDNTDLGTDASNAANEGTRNLLDRPSLRGDDGAEDEGDAGTGRFEFSDPNIARAARRQAATSELTTAPDYGIPHERQAFEDRPAADGGEASNNAGLLSGANEVAQNPTGASGEAFGVVAELKGTGTDYSEYAGEGALTNQRLAGLGQVPVEAGFMMDKAAEAAAVDTTPSVEVGPVLAAAVGAAFGSQVVYLPAVLLGADDAAVDKLVSMTDEAKWAEEMDAKAKWAKLMADTGQKDALKHPGGQSSPAPGASQPPEGDFGTTGRPTPAEWAYRQWLYETTGRNPFGPGSGDVDPVDEPVGTAVGVNPPASAVEHFGQPPSGETTGIRPRGELNVGLLPGDKGNVDPGEGDDTGPWTSNQMTEDPEDALNTGVTLGIGALPRNDTEEDEDGEEATDSE